MDRGGDLGGETLARVVDLADVCGQTAEGLCLN